jgi:acetolactate decarboxylase
MKIIKNFILIFLFASLASCLAFPREKDILFQISTINALMNGAYEGEITFEELKRHGDVGIGTFDALDGEMIGLEGSFYQIKADGIAYPVPDSMTTPFAVVTPFEADKTVSITNSMDYAGLQYYLDQLIPDKTIFYAIKITGTFQYIKTRSVPKQKQPYPPLVEAVKRQTIFEFHDTQGTIIGFRCPDSVKGGINVPGYHLHFITADRKAGGHLLACQLQHGTVTFDYTSKFYMVPPRHESTPHTSELTKNRSGELKQVEGN